MRQPAPESAMISCSDPQGPRVAIVFDQSACDEGRLANITPFLINSMVIFSRKGANLPVVVVGGSHVWRLAYFFDDYCMLVGTRIS
jgi:hypothetical protein